MSNNKIIVTGTEKDAAAFSLRLQEIGFDAIPLPTISIEKNALDRASIAALKDFETVESYDYLLFTSPHAAEFFAEALRDLWIKKPANIQVAAVGPATARALRAIGFDAHIIPKESGVDELIGTLKDISGKKILFLRSANAPDEAIDALRARGAIVTPIILYATTSITADKKIFEETMRDADRIIFLSPSGIAGFAKNFHENILTGHALETRTLCIGPTTAQAASRAGFRHITIATPSTLFGIIKALRND